MKTSIANGLRRGLKAAGIGATVAVAIGFASAGAANADTFVPLPDGSITETLNGTTVTVSRVGETANISPSMGATALHRNVWVSGTAKVEISGQGAEKATTKFQPGYIVACQINLGGTAGGGAGVKAGYAGESASITPSINGNGTVTLGPGQAQDFKILDRTIANAFDEEQHVPFNVVKGPNGSVTWTDSTLAVSGCAGYAQARNYIKVTVDTGTNVQQVTLWGQPFSIG
ncbi:MspA family porin [Rhodococcus aetherivorans]|uniref:MspA family porin n=1 Tax=Rhodococcus aetherivorans TaxID=191292 RepID=A0AA46P3A9_9NOCA|nr:MULTISPECIES: MspA family porin [Rhodococcus]QIX51755.1 MspA family porin [Rhodococcus sp. DMU1]UGQ42586.1 MspA family porin [Rhodococcus aetherivorans]USC14179.1 MspA family porin [Rhodococcus sp. 11-3]UYF95773.1 MspA family porin [Rhodococcus aetherivorans]